VPGSSSGIICIMNKPPSTPRVDKTAFSVASLAEADDDKAYWRSKSVSVCGRLSSCGKSFMATSLLPADFKEFLKLLNSRQVEYLLIGGYAVGYHGYPRATADIDIWIATNPPNAHKVAIGNVLAQ